VCILNKIQTMITFASLFIKWSCNCVFHILLLCHLNLISSQNRDNLNELNEWSDVIIKLKLIWCTWVTCTRFEVNLIQHCFAIIVILWWSLSVCKLKKWIIFAQSFEPELSKLAYFKFNQRHYKLFTLFGDQVKAYTNICMANM